MSLLIEIIIGSLNFTLMIHSGMAKVMSVEGPCCTCSNLPQLYKKLGYPKVDSIEMWLCYNYDTSDEDVLFNLVEIYVK